MIEINLLPEDLKRKRHKSLLPGGINIPMEVIVGSAGGLLVLIVLLHIVLAGINLMKIGQLKKLKMAWAEIEPDKKGVDAVLQDLRKLQAQKKSVQEVLGEEKVVWSQKLNIISDSLPRGVWIQKVALTDDMLFVDGSAISKGNTGMFNVHSFMTALKDNKTFQENLKEMELGSIQRRMVDTVEIADFLITAQR